MGFFISIVVTLAVLLFEAVESGTSLGRTNGKDKKDNKSELKE